MSYYRITVTLLEPFCCSVRPLEGNETVTLPWIPATTLRGAAAWKLSASGHTGSLDAMLGADGPLWAPAWPSDGKAGETIVPTPLCYVLDKSGDLPGIRNRFLERADRQWISVKAPFLAIDEGGAPVRDIYRAQEIKMRNALDYQRQASRGEDLYARGELPEATKFAAWLEVPDGGAPPVEALDGEVFLGKRLTAGSGKSTWKIESDVGDPPWKATPFPDAGDLVRIQLMSDAIVPEALGAFASGFSPSLLAGAMGISETRVTQLRAWSSRGSVFGWSRAWGLPREQAIAIRAGSVCEFRVDLPEPARRAAVACLAGGIGIRRVEGFGILAVQPVWLYRDLPLASTAKPVPTGKSRPPAGLGRDAESLQGLSRLLHKLPRWKDEAEASRAVALAAHSIRMKDMEEVKRFLGASKGWDGINREVQSFDKELRNATLADLQYWLRASAAFHKRSAGKETPHA